MNLQQISDTFRKILGSS